MVPSSENVIINLNCLVLDDKPSADGDPAMTSENILLKKLLGRSKVGQVDSMGRRVSEVGQSVAPLCSSHLAKKMASHSSSVL